MGIPSFFIYNNSSNYAVDCKIEWQLLVNNVWTTKSSVTKTISASGSTVTYPPANKNIHLIITLSNCYINSNGDTKYTTTWGESDPLINDASYKITPYFKVKAKTSNASKGTVSDDIIHYLQDYYAGGSDILLSNASPNDSYGFVNWTSDSGSSSWSRSDLWVRPDRNETWTANFEKVQYTLIYDPGDCNMSPSATSITKDSGSGVSLPKLSKSSTTDYKKPIYKVSWIDNLDKSASKVVDSNPGATKITYSNFMWKGSDGSTYESGGYISDLRSNIKFTASKDTDYEITKQASVGAVPTQTNVDGYINRFWYTSTDTSGDRASSSMKIDNNITFYSVREGKTYNIKFNSYPTNIIWPEDSKPVTIKKQFGTGSNEFPTSIPIRKGYEFVGWSTSKDTDWRNPIYSERDPAEIRKLNAWWNPSILRPGASLDDYFDKTYSVNGSDVSLYTIWRPINHYIQLNWYVKNSDEVQQYKKRYTIEDVVVDVFSPTTYDTGKAVMTGDWVFFGYKTYNDDSIKQTEWADTKGIYRNINLISGVNLPYSRPVSSDDWTWSDDNEGLITENIYGFWTITGKYVNVNGSWKKVTCVYLNIGGGSVWRPMNGTSDDETSFSINVGDKWYKEVH